MIYLRTLLLFGLFFSTIFPQQGKYKRKSVSSLESVWIKPGSLKNIDKVDIKILDNFMEFYIEIPRFDFNTLPKSQINAFVNEANALEVVDTKTLSKVMENTILDEILSVLNDPDIQNKRGQKLKDESDFESFAATKAKSIGLTTDQLSSLMNSAYIYLPYISKMESKEEKGNLDISMEGGIIWWRVKVDGNGTASIDKVLDATTSVTNSIDLNSKDLKGKKRTYKKYTFGDKKFDTTPYTYVQGDAMLAFAKNLSVKTRELSDFKLQAQVAEKDRNSYGFQLGLADGVHLDDGFFLVELTEDSEGNEKEVNLGFLRVSKSGKNKNDATALSTAKQIFGEKGDVGSIVMEHPRLGMDSRIRLGMRSGLNIEPGHALDFIEKTAESAFMLGFDLSYNLAPIINSSQTFLDFGFTFGVINAELTEDAIDNKVFPYIWGAGLGLSKKFWFGRMNVPVGLSYGIESLSFSSSEGESLFLSGFGGKLNTGFEYMIDANTTFNIGVQYNIVPEISSISFYEDGEEVDLSESLGDDFLDLWNEGDLLGNDPLSLSGLSIKVGIDYSLGELGFDVFGFLDPLKKH